MPDAPDLTPLETAVLAILRSAKGNPVRGRTRLQKLAFLLAHLPGTPELREETSFEALHYGPFSEALNDTVKMMAEADLVSIAEGRPRGFVLTRNGARIAEQVRKSHRELFKESERLVDILADVPQNDLIALVYELYPGFAKESEIRGIRSTNVDAVHVPIEVLLKERTIELSSTKGIKYEISVDNNRLVLREVEQEAQ